MEPEVWGHLGWGEGALNLNYLKPELYLVAMAIFDVSE